MASLTRRRFWKATRPDGTDFRTGRVDYAGALASGEVVVCPDPLAVFGEHPLVEYSPLPRHEQRRVDPHFFLSIATIPTDCIGMEWPCRLFQVEIVSPGTGWQPYSYWLPNTWACRSLRVVEEWPAHEALGPQGEYVAAMLVPYTKVLKPSESMWRSLSSVRAAATAAKRSAAMALLDSQVNGWAMQGVLVRDLISRADYDNLTRPWREHVGPIHPDDPDWMN